MKKINLLVFYAFFCILKLNAQGEDDYNAIKLFISQYDIAEDNNTLTMNMQDRLYQKVTQLINQTGIVEIGYSTFLVAPKFDVISVSSSEAGITKVYLAECELSIFIRRARVGGSGDATFGSFSKTITGSGSGKDQAIANAINNISVSDNDVINFLKNSKAKIDAYFKTHCPDVIKEAQQALALKNYEGSIALYFSVPSDAPCYQQALDASEKVYKTYVKDQCDKNLIKLKAYVALAQTQNNTQKNYYDSALNIMSNMNPASDKCFEEARNEIEKIDKRLNEEQKQNWELIKQTSINNSDVKKEMYKAMGRISSNYQPSSPATNVIIAH